MRIGVGGGLGPFRAGVSTKGFGGGVGPVSLGGRWRGGGGGGGCGGSLLALIVQWTLIGLVVFWPYLLGAWLVEQAGAAPQSVATQVGGWALETLYVGGVGWFIIGRRLQRRRAAREAAEQTLAAEAMRRRAIADWEFEVCQQLLDQMDRSPEGRSDERVPSTEKLLIALERVSLVEPRSAYRNGPKVQKRVDEGTALVTDRSIRFQGANKSVEWRYDKMQAATRGDDHVRFSVSNRQLVSGLSGTSVGVIASAVNWGRAVAAGGDAMAVRGALVTDLQQLHVRRDRARGRFVAASVR